MDGAIDKVGFVGFGEAAYHIAKGLRGAGVDRVYAYDINTHAPALGEKIRGRAGETQTELVGSNAALGEASNVIFSAVTADQALEAARQTAPHLRAGHYYIDLNSVSPRGKQEIGKTVSGGG